MNTALRIVLTLGGLVLTAAAVALLAPATPPESTIRPRAASEPPPRSLRPDRLSARPAIPAAPSPLVADLALDPPQPAPCAVADLQHLRSEPPTAEVPDGTALGTRVGPEIIPALGSGAVPLPPPSDRAQAWEDGVAEVEHAGGTVRLEAPAVWRIAESPDGRELRLVISPDPLPKRGRMPKEGIWLVYHVVPEGLSPAQWRPWIPERLWGWLHDAPPGRTTRLAGYGATYEPLVGSGSRGFRLAIRTEIGLLEAVARTADDAAAPQRLAVYQEILETVRFRQPRMPSGKPAVGARSAEPLWGSWKAYRSRLRLEPSGRIYVCEDQFPDKAEQPAEIVDGQYFADGDLLRVQWRDGSQLNIRWKIADGRLLLTDHRGRTSQLRPIFE